MKRLEKAILTSVRSLAYGMKIEKLYYYSDLRLRRMSSVVVMPRFYYSCLHKVCLRMADFRNLQRLADKVIHTIPLQIRFELA